MTFHCFPVFRFCSALLVDTFVVMQDAAKAICRSVLIALRGMLTTVDPFPFSTVNR